MCGIRSPGSRRGLVWESRERLCRHDHRRGAAMCGIRSHRLRSGLVWEGNPDTDHILKLKVCQRSRKSHWPTVRLPTLMRAVPRMPGVKTPSGSSSDVITS